MYKEEHMGERDTGRKTQRIQEREESGKEGRHKEEGIKEESGKEEIRDGRKKHRMNGIQQDRNTWTKDT